MNNENTKLPTFVEILRDPVQLLALGLGSGLMPKAPGTWGSAMAVILFLLMLPVLGYNAMLGVVVLSFFVGIYLCDASAKKLGVHDHPAIVWDEFVGQWMVLLFMFWGYGLSSVLAIAVGFGLFRVFDILKPWPVKVADTNVSGGFGIMLDDVLAALYAMLCVAITMEALNVFLG